jgi:putative SOS response-associated peptidase YedK
MCFHYSMSQVAQNLENRYNAPFAQGAGFEPQHHANGFNFPAMPVVIANPVTAIELFTWGLIPAWTSDFTQADKMRAMTLNARSETAFEKPSFRKSIATHRCLVPADGFFEWQTIGEKKIPWFIKTKDREIFSFGGIWEKWNSPDGDSLFTFSILTTDANVLMADIHNSKKRMPLILRPDDEKSWLDSSLSGEAVQQLMVPFPESEMTAWTISRMITARGVNTNSPEVKKPFSWSLLKL